MTLTTEDRSETQPDGHPVGRALARYGPAVALAALLGAFAAVNARSTRVDFLAFEADAPLILVILAAAVIGGVLTWMFTALARHRRSSA